MGFLSERLLANGAPVVLLACVNLEMHPEVTGVAEGFAAVFTLVRFHSNVSHEVHVELRGCDECLGAHAALKLLLPHVALTLRPGGAVRSVPSTVGSTAAVVTVIWLSRSMAVTGPWRGGGARRAVG